MPLIRMLNTFLKEKNTWKTTGGKQQNWVAFRSFRSCSVKGGVSCTKGREMFVIHDLASGIHAVSLHRQKR